MGLFKRLFAKKENDKEKKSEESLLKSEASEELLADQFIEPPKFATGSPAKATDEIEKILDQEEEISEEEIETVEDEADTTEEVGEYNVESADEFNTEDATKKVKVKGFGGAFEIKKSKDGRFVFNLYAKNRVIVATSQIYSSSTSAVNGIKSVIANAEKAAIEDQTLKSFTSQSFPKWEIYIDKTGQFRFRLLATNGSCICHSQGYTQKSTCKKGIESVIRTVKSAEIDKAYLKK